MRQIQAEIIRNEMIAPSFYRMRVKALYLAKSLKELLTFKILVVNEFRVCQLIDTSEFKQKLLGKFNNTRR